MSTRLISLPFYNCLIIIFVLLTAIVNGTCFWIDGTEAKNRFTCYDLNSVGASMCCDSTFVADFDKCIGGICVYNSSLAVQGIYNDKQSFWRDSCSDPRWQDPACLAMAPCMQILCCLPTSVSRRNAFKNLEEAERQYVNGNKANCSFFFQLLRTRKPA